MTRRIHNILFTDDDQRLIKQACGCWDDNKGLIDLGKDDFRLPDVLLDKLQEYGCFASSEGWILNAKTLRLKEELDEPIDQWEWLSDWFRTRRWSIPVAVVVVVVPIIAQYVEILSKLIAYLTSVR